MPRQKLNQKIVDRLRAPDPSGKQKFHFDAAMPGFGVRCSGKTPLKVYVVQRDLHFPNGKTSTRRVVLGTTAELTFEQARDEARDKIHQMRGGIDPKRVVHKGASTLGQWLETYLGRERLVERSRDDLRKNTERHLSDWLNLELGGITGQMVKDRHGKIGKDHPAMANSVMRGFRAIYNYALVRETALPPNPTQWLRGHWFKIKRRTRRVTGDQLPIFYPSVLKLPNPIQRDYVLFVLFTGIRREQAAGMTWDLIDFTAKVIRFPADATKGKTDFNLPMTDYVYDLLLKRRKIGDTHFVFPAKSKSGYIREPKYPFSLIKEMTGIHWSIHDLRRSYADALNDTPMSVYKLKALMDHAHAHEGQDVTGGYLSTEALRAPAQAACDLLKARCGLGKTRKTQGAGKKGKSVLGLAMG